MMSVSHLSTDHLTPFWKALELEGYAVGVLDVPFAPIAGLQKGVEISEWGAYDFLRGRMEVSPPALLDWVLKSAGSHPFTTSVIEVLGPHDHQGLAKAVSLFLAGVRERGTLATRLLTEMELDLLLIVFPEVHQASHLLWHTIDPAHPAHNAEGAPPIVTRGLIDIYREVDRQIARLLDAAGPETAVLVFSLHGMRAKEGVPTILDPLLQNLGYACVKDWKTRSWSERARSAVAALKQRTPPRLKRLYHRVASRSVMLRFVQQGMMPAYDWSRTVAFPLPDQNGLNLTGWIRLNLMGREAQGILNSGKYHETCDRLEAVLRGLRTEGGKPVVKDVLRIARETGGAPPQHLPDLIIHWEDAASASPLRLRTPTISARPIGTKFTGQHAPEGFFILRPGPGGIVNPEGSIAAEDLHQLLLGALKGG
jgi:predicted AlkP superfamily phosphohydrolase/phosphomutase